MKNKTETQREVMLHEERPQSRDREKKRRGNTTPNVSVKTNPENRDEYLIEFNIRDSRELTESQKDTILRTLMENPDKKTESQQHRRSPSKKPRENHLLQEHEIQSQKQEQAQSEDIDKKKPVLQVIADNPGIIPIYISGFFSGVAVTLFLV